MTRPRGVHRHTSAGPGAVVAVVEASAPVSAVSPLQLVPTDVITVNPWTGEQGAWTFIKFCDEGSQVRLEVVAADGRTPAVFQVDRTDLIHVAPRGDVVDVWGAA